MKKAWNKNNITYTMVGENHPKGLKRNFSNLVEDLSDVQIQSFGKILSDLSDEVFTKAALTSTNDFIVD
ncbi:hypothetical protein GSH19_03535 [Lactobacillus sp. S2-2]|uniref:DUF1659 domain-containing protein n=1 Tax=Lactobacillus sp. S2-2 TaxID=2692917 RepID=UPI001F30D3A8|nr:hypothetical protein [Lactobacillus sp. S2-2]MCF6515226.1 hypothetical protein [Lactobacillus sp. S2-2]